MNIPNFNLDSALARWTELQKEINALQVSQSLIEQEISQNIGYTLSATLTFWHATEIESGRYKALENNHRKEIFNKEFPDAEKGTNKKRIDHGMALIATHKINYKVDKAVLDSMIKEPELAPIIHAVINFEPKVRAGELEKLSDEDRNKIAGMITETPGTPALEIKPQTKVRWS